MLSEESFSSGEEYAKSLINLINLSRLEDPTSKAEDNEVYEYWFKEIIEGCKLKYYKYICGDEPSYRLNEEEIMSYYKTAVKKLTGDILTKLVDSGDVKMGVDSEGEIVYAATESGLKRVKNRSKK